MFLLLLSSQRKWTRSPTPEEDTATQRTPVRLRRGYPWFQFASVLLLWLFDCCWLDCCSCQREGCGVVVCQGEDWRVWFVFQILLWTSCFTMGRECTKRWGWDGKRKDWRTCTQKWIVVIGGDCLLVWEKERMMRDAFRRVIGKCIWGIKCKDYVNITIFFQESFVCSS